MIAQLLERARSLVQTADLVLKTDETLTLAIDATRRTSAQVSHLTGVNLRVVLEGRSGHAGSTAEDPDDLLWAAVMAARQGEPASFHLPPVARPAPVLTAYPRAASAGVDEVGRLGRLIQDRLATEGVTSQVIVERSVGAVQVGNTCGLDAAYDVSRVTVTAEVLQPLGNRRLRLIERVSGADLPELEALERMVDRLRERSDWSRRVAEPPNGRLAVCFAGEAALALLLPLEQALIGKAALLGQSPLAGRRGTRVVSELLTVADDPLLDGRPGSRPLDDEGTPSRRVELIQSGVVEGFVYDLETAARAGVPPTGHGRRTVFGRPQAAYSNLVVAPGTADWPSLLGALGDGVVVERFRGWGRGNVLGGTFSLPAAVAWRVRNGEIEGALEEITLAGNAYDLLNRVRGVGNELQWTGSCGLPPLLVEEVAVLGRAA
jgi:PmbA protein